MAGTSDLPFSRAELDTLREKLNEFAEERLSEHQQSLLVAIFTRAAEQAETWSDPGPGQPSKIKVKYTEREIEIPIHTDVNELIAQLRRAFTRGEDGKATVYCVVPVNPVTPKPGPGPHTEPNA